MAKCANCVNEAFYTYQVTAHFAIQYCSRHLPAFLQGPKYAGRLVKTIVKTAPVVEAPVVEEPVVEEVPVVQEPAPTKNSKKKSTPVVDETPEEAPVEEPIVEEVVDAPASEEVEEDATN